MCPTNVSLYTKRDSIYYEKNAYRKQCGKYENKTPLLRPIRSRRTLWNMHRVFHHLYDMSDFLLRISHFKRNSRSERERDRGMRLALLDFILILLHIDFWETSKNDVVAGSHFLQINIYYDFYLRECFFIGIKIVSIVESAPGFNFFIHIFYILLDMANVWWLFNRCASTWWKWMTNENSFEFQFESLWLFVRAAAAAIVVAIPNQFLVPTNQWYWPIPISIHCTWIECSNFQYPLTSGIERNK